MEPKHWMILVGFLTSVLLIFYSSGFKGVAFVPVIVIAVTVVTLTEYFLGFVPAMIVLGLCVVIAAKIKVIMQNKHK